MAQATNPRWLLAGLFFFAGVVALLVMNGYPFYNALACLGLWAMSLLLLWPDAARGKRTAIALAAFVIFAIFTIALSLPARLEWERKWERMKDRRRHQREVQHEERRDHSVQSPDRAADGGGAD